MNPYYFNPMNMNYMNPNPYYQSGPMNTGNGGNFKTGGYYGGRGGSKQLLWTYLLILLGRGRGGFNKRGGRGGFRGKKNYFKSGDQPSNVEVNDNEFPPLSNEEVIRKNQYSKIHRELSK